MLRKILLSLSILSSLCINEVVASDKAIAFSYNHKSLECGTYPASLGEACHISVLHVDHEKENLICYTKQQRRTRKTDLYIQILDISVWGCPHERIHGCWLYYLRLL